MDIEKEIIERTVFGYPLLFAVLYGGIAVIDIIMVVYEIGKWLGVW